MLKEIEPYLDPYAEGLTTPGGLSASIRTRIVAAYIPQHQTSTSTSSILERSSNQRVSTGTSLSNNTTKVSNTGVIHLPTMNHSIGSHHHSLSFDSLYNAFHDQYVVYYPFVFLLSVSSQPV